MFQHFAVEVRNLLYVWVNVVNLDSSGLGELADLTGDTGVVSQRCKSVHFRLSGAVVSYANKLGPPSSFSTSPHRHCKESQTCLISWV